MQGLWLFRLSRLYYLRRNKRMSSQEVPTAPAPNVVKLELTHEQLRYLLPSLQTARAAAIANSDSYQPGWTDEHRAQSRRKRDALTAIITQIRERLHP